MTSRSTAVVAAGFMLLAACGSGGSSDAAEDTGDVSSETAAPTTTERAVVVSSETAAPTTTERAVVTTMPPTAESTVQSTEKTDAEPAVGGIPDFVFGIDTAVRFDAGGTSALLADAVIRGERNRYTLEAAAGQTMNLTISSLEDNAVFEVYGPEESVLVAETTSASFQLPSDGVYTIIVGGTRGNASYELTVEIPAL